MNVEAIRALKYLRVSARDNDIGQDNISLLVSSQDDTLACLQKKDFRHTSCYDNKCGSFIEGSNNISRDGAARSWQQER